MGIFEKLKNNKTQNMKTEDTNKTSELSEEELEKITSLSIQDYADYLTNEEYFQIMNKYKDKNEAMNFINILVSQRKKETVMNEKYNQEKTK